MKTRGEIEAELANLEQQLALIVTECSDQDEALEAFASAAECLTECAPEEFCELIDQRIDVMLAKAGLTNVEQ